MEESPLIHPVPSYPKLKYKLKRRKKQFTYLQATQTIQTMFVQQSELWKRQAIELEKIANLTEAQVEDRMIDTETPVHGVRNLRSASSTSKKDDSSKHLSRCDAIEQETMEVLLEKINKSKRWEFEREEEEANLSKKENGSDVESDKSSQR